MYYGHPGYSVFILTATFVLVLFFMWTASRRKAHIRRFADESLAAQIAPTVSRLGRTVKTLGLALAFFLMLFALSEPQWGFIWQETRRVGLDIVIAMDVSKSMLAKDVKPNRLERSKFAVKDLVKKLNGDRIALVAFAGTAFVQCPLTIDYNGFLLALDDLNVGTIPRGGTSISSAIKEAAAVFGEQKKYKVLVIISDGEELEGDALKAADDAARNGIKIYCVGVGSADGELIPQVDGQGRGGYLADRSGQAVKSRLNEDLLKRVAISTGGGYVRATQAEFGLLLLYDKSISKLEKRDIETKMRKSYQQRFQIFLVIALAILFLEPFIPERRRVAAR